MHMHFSLMNTQNRNVFDDGSINGSETLRAAVGGVQNYANELMLINAPTRNSYRRFGEGAGAPTVANWGHEDRRVAIRIPDSPNADRRIEHRIACADANPYLVVAGVLASALEGILQNIAPTTSDE
ncbi:UNVERIFIED_CONTAM: hypothetical protein GTU68_049863, partial [Idotea baltica]|nr:hypothetical protein [Idotea baltica]